MKKLADIDSTLPRKAKPVPPGIGGPRGTPQNPKPLTIKQEGFARAYVGNSGNGARAYAQIYDVSATTTVETLSRKAHELTHEHPGVAARIKQLREEYFGSVTVGSLTADLEDDRQLARSLGQPAAAIGATKVKAQLAGLIDSGRDSASAVIRELANLVESLDKRERLERRESIDSETATDADFEDYQ